MTFSAPPPSLTAQGGATIAIDIPHVAPWTVGVEGTFTVVLTNIGSAPTAGEAHVYTIAELPDTLTAQSASGPGWTCTGAPQFDCLSTAAIAPDGKFPPLTFKVTPSAAAAPGVTVNLNASQGAVAVEGVQCMAVAPAADPAAARSDLSIEMRNVSGFADMRVGHSAAFAGVVTNNGPQPTSSRTCVLLTAPFKSGSTGSASGSGWTCEFVRGDVHRCVSDAMIAPGAAFPTITFTVTPTAAIPSPAIGSAQVANPYDLAIGNDVVQFGAPIIIPDSDHALSVTSAATYTQGVPATITVDVTNAGPFAAPYDVRVQPVGTWPASFSQISGAGTGWTCGTSCRTSAKIPAGGSFPPITFTFTPTAGPPQSGSLQFRVDGVPPYSDPNPDNNVATVTFTITAAPATSTTTTAPTAPTSTVPTSTLPGAVIPTLGSTLPPGGVIPTIGPTLPVSGVAPGWSVALAIGVLASGAGLVAISRRRGSSLGRH